MGIFSKIGGLIVPGAAPSVPRTRIEPSARPTYSAGLQGGFQGQVFPYDAASIQSTEMGDWLPTIRHPDMEINWNRDRVVARSRDMVRNDGWASGAVMRLLDQLLGACYRLTAMPDYAALRQYSSAFDAVWAADFKAAAEAEWRLFSEDVGHYNDLGRQMTVTQQMRQTLSHQLVDGDGLVLAHWRPDRIGRGAARYATTFQVVDPDRLCNPFQQVDLGNLRGGVELDDDGVPVGYHVRKAEPNSFYDAVQSMQWERIDREDPDGWNRAIHHYERLRADQHRGVGIFTPILMRLKMLARYYGVELQAATVASVFGTYVTSPFDPQLVEDALTPDGENQGLQSLYTYQGLREQFHSERKPQLDGAVMPTLAPGEKIETVKAERPAGNFSPFTHEMLRGIASCLGVSYEELTQDFSETNYSSARAAVAQTERTVRRRVGEFNTGCASKMYSNWLHEAMELGRVPLPRNAPDFVEMRTAYARCRWRGPGSGLIDGVKERQAAVLGMDAGLITLEQAVADESGGDWREVLEQRAIELAKIKELGLPPPSWTAIQNGAGKTDSTDEKPMP